MSDRYILITGANGFVGSIVTNELLRFGYKVKAFARNDTLKSTTSGNYIAIKADLEDYCNLKEVIKGSDAIIHLASTRSDLVGELEKDIMGLEALIRNRRRGTFIFASSQDVYGVFNVTPVNETSTLNPCSRYSKGKVMAEKMLLESETLNDSLIILRLPMIFGTHIKMSLSIIDKVLSKALRGEDFYLPCEYLKNSFDYGSSWIDIESVSKFIMQCLHKTSHSTINIADGFLSWHELITKTILFTNSNSRIEFSQHIESDFHWLVYRLELDCSKAKQMHGFHPSGKLQHSLSQMIRFKLIMRDLVLNENLEYAEF